MTESKYLLHLVLVLCTVLCVLSETHREALCQTSRNLGYVCEIHVIQTEDGFLLQSERLPNYGGYPVFLQHGLLDASNTWVMNYFPDQNLATILHDAGYDVWMGNSRGNVYSSNHVVLDQSESAFWDNVDMDLMAMYDVPANIEYVLKATNHTSLTWVGHSQGTWQGFSAFSTLHPTYATKVDLFVALGPVATAGHQKSLILDALLALHTDQFVGFFGDRAFLPQGNFIHILSKICLSRLEICTNGLAMLCGGANIHNVNSTQIYELTKYGPGGTSVHNMQHWAQLARSKKYQMFDYGQIKNMQHYEQSEPPQYTLHKYSGPKLALFYGQDDKLADLEDVSYIIQQIPQKYIVHQEEIASYGHMDFVWGMNAKDIVYNKILKLLNEHIPNDRIQRREVA